MNTFLPKEQNTTALHEAELWKNGPDSNWENLEEAKEMKTVHDAKFIYNFSRLVLHPRSVPCPVKRNSSER